MRTTVTQSNYRRQVAAVLAQRLVRELAAEPAIAFARMDEYRPSPASPLRADLEAARLGAVHA